MRGCWGSVKGEQLLGGSPADGVGGAADSRGGCDPTWGREGDPRDDGIREMWPHVPTQSGGCWPAPATLWVLQQTDTSRASISSSIPPLPNAIPVFPLRTPLSSPSNPTVLFFQQLTRSGVPLGQPAAFLPFHPKISLRTCCQPRTCLPSQKANSADEQKALKSSGAREKCVKN